MSSESSTESFFQNSSTWNLSAWNDDSNASSNYSGNASWNYSSNVSTSLQPITSTTEAPLKTVDIGDWSDFQSHVIICASCWLSLSFLSLIMQTCRRSWEAEGVEASLLNLTVRLKSNRRYLVVSILGAFYMCACHVLATLGILNTSLGIVEILACLIYLFEMVALWLYATAKSSSASIAWNSGRLVVDCLIIPSVLVSRLSGRPQFSFNYIAAARIASLWVQFVEATFDTKSWGLPQLALSGSLELVSVLFAAAMLMAQVESLPVASRWAFPNANEALLGQLADPWNRWTVSSGIYNIFISILDVGYGDLVPRTMQGIVAGAIATIGGMLRLLRSGLGILQALETGHAGGGEYEPRRHMRHIVITGSPSFHVLKDFLLELYHPKMLAQSSDLNAVILLLPGQRPIMDAMKQWLKQRENAHLYNRIWLVQGSAMSHDDLSRVQYQSAAMAFLLPNPYTTDLQREDLGNTMRALRMKTHTPHVRLLALILKAENKDLMISAGVEWIDIVCDEELKLGLMAQACEVNGFLAAAPILFKAISREECQHLGALPGAKWVDDYADGLMNGIYEVPLSQAYVGCPFCEVAVDIVDKSNCSAFLVGLIEEPMFPSDKTLVKLFPNRQYRIMTSPDRKHKGIFMAKNKDDIKQLPDDAKLTWLYKSFAIGKTTTSNDEDVRVARKETVGWVREPRDIRVANKENLDHYMKRTATLRAVAGLKKNIDADAQIMEDLLGSEAAQILRRLGMAEADEERESEDVLDQKMMQVKQQAQRQAEDELNQLEVKAIRAKEDGIIQGCRIAISEAMRDLEKEDRQQQTGHTKEEKEEDVLLYGGPPDPAPKLFGPPQEPPAVVTLRGDHVLFLALDMKQPTLSSKVDREVSFDDPLLPGRKLGLKIFLRSLRCGRIIKRPVVVLSSQVPLDWHEAAAEGDVYLVRGRPLLASTLHSAGLTTARAVVIHQRLASFESGDISPADSEAILAARYVESLLEASGCKHIPVFCDIMLERSIKSLSTKSKVEASMQGADEDDEDEKGKRDAKAPIEQRTPYYGQPRFASGLLYLTNTAPILMANMLYAPIIGSVLQMLVMTPFVVEPVPDGWHGHSLAKLYNSMLRRRNLVVIGAWRRHDADIDIEELEEEAGRLEDPATKEEAMKRIKGHTRTHRENGEEVPGTWQPGEPHNSRYLVLHPGREAMVLRHDGLLCIGPTEGRPNPQAVAVLPPKLSRFIMREAAPT